MEKKRRRYIGILLLAAAVTVFAGRAGGMMAFASATGSDAEEPSDTDKTQAEISGEDKPEDDSSNQSASDQTAAGSDASKDDKSKPYDSDYTDKLEDQRKDTINKISGIRSELADVKNNIKALQAEKGNLQSYIARLDQEAGALADQIARLAEDIDAKNDEISQTEADLEEAERVADKQYEDMKARIQYLYENGTPSYLELLLTSQSIGDFLNRSTYAAEISRYDRNMLDMYIAQKEEIAATRERLEVEKEELDLMAEAAREQKEAVDALIQTKTAQIQSYQNQIAAQNAEAADFQEDLEEQEKLLNQIEAQIAAAALANASDGDGDGGASGFVWPCPSSRRITSGFGPRSKPMPGASSDHKGIDIGASSGAAVLASAAGRVTTAAYSNSAGNYIVISHGNGLSTVYMHCSALYVSAGQMVSQGQTIAAVGSTGFSTAPHLHFGVIKSGVYVNPRNYV